MDVNLQNKMNNMINRRRDKLFYWLLFALIFGSVIGVLFWGYSYHHMSRMYALLLPSGDGLDGNLSPSGRWVINIERLGENNDYEHTYHKIYLTSVNNPYKRSILTAYGDFNFYRFDYAHGFPDSWSPLGNAFFMVRNSNRFCLDQHFVMFNEENGVWQGPYYYGVPEKTGDNCYGLAWSNDGTKLALYTRSYGDNKEEKFHLKIFNQKAELLLEFDIQAPGVKEGIDYLYWNEDEFFLQSANSWNNQVPTRLYYFSSLHPEYVTHLVDFPGFYQIIGKEPKSNRILLNNFNIGNACQSTVFNVNTQQIEKKIDVEDRCIRAESSLDDQQIFLTTDKGEAEYKILFWDWDTLAYQYKGTTSGNIVWQNDLVGLLVLKKDAEEHYYFNVIRP